MNPTPNRAHEAKRQEIADHTAEFKRRGGKIRQIPFGVTPDQRETVALPWTSSLGALSEQRKRKQGEYTVKPGWESRPILRGRQPKPYACEDCGDTDASKRAGNRHLCLSCKSLRRKAQTANLCRTGRKGRGVRIWREGESLEFKSGRDAAQHIGVVPSSVCTALQRGREVKGWRAEYVE